MQTTSQCLHFNYGMIVTFGIYLSLIASFQVTLNLQEAFHSCLFYAKFIYWSGTCIMLLGSIGDLLIDFAKVAKSKLALSHQEYALYIMYPNDVSPIYTTVFTKKHPKNMKKILLYLFVFWTILIRFISNIVIAISIPFLTLFNYVDSFDCIFKYPEEWLIIQMAILIFLLLIRISATASFKIQETEEDYSED